MTLQFFEPNFLRSEPNGTRKTNVDSVLSIRMRKAREAQRLTRLYGTNIKSVATSAIRFKPKIINHKINADVKRDQSRKSFAALSTAVSQFRKKASRSQSSHENNRGKCKHIDIKLNSSIDRLARPKSSVTKFQDRTEQESSEKDTQMSTTMHADNHMNIGQPWFLGYCNSPVLPAGSPISIASRYGYQGAIRLTRQCTHRNDFRVAINRNPAISTSNTTSESEQGFPQITLQLPSPQQVSNEYNTSFHYETDLNSNCPYEWHDRKPLKWNYHRPQDGCRSELRDGPTSSNQEDGLYKSLEFETKKKFQKRISPHFLNAVEREQQVWQTIAEKAILERKTNQRNSCKSKPKKFATKQISMRPKEKTGKFLFVLR